ncbi:MAG: hypothetical protein FWD03_00670 [Defluviitaleaceae bacterium]|nr:hypothetical protein [Defluviitaleaceae bacterium]
MNIIRSKVVELSTIPAMAYKVKLRPSGSGIKIHRTDQELTAFAEIDKRTGEPQPDRRTLAALFPAEAFEEAAELLSGLAYSARGKVKIMISETADSDEIEVPEDEAPGTHQDPIANAVDCDEFIAITGMYSDVSGKINYQLMNKQFIQFASRSKTVMDMVNEKASVDDILLHVVKSRAAHLSGKKDSLPDAEARALIDAIEDMDTRGAFKELKLHLRKMMAR